MAGYQAVQRVDRLVVSLLVEERQGQNPEIARRILRVEPHRPARILFRFRARVRRRSGSWRG